MNAFEDLFVLDDVPSGGVADRSQQAAVGRTTEATDTTLAPPQPSGTSPTEETSDSWPLASWSHQLLMPAPVTSQQSQRKGLSGLLDLRGRALSSKQVWENV
jgi:hypothetical protein